jgi:acetyltransferase-like isoleucine patch superfamily enzyme
MKPYFLAAALFSQFVGGIVLAISLAPVVLLNLAILPYLSNLQNWVFKVSGMSLMFGMDFVLFGNLLLLTIVGLRHLFRLKNQEYAGDIDNPASVFGGHFPELQRNWILARLGTYNFLLNLAQVIYLPFIRSTPLINWFYRGMGARIGPGTLIATTRIFDCDLIEIGSGCIIGGGSAITAHSAEGSIGMLKKVVVGNHVTIGANSYIMPGVVIEDHVRVGPNSLVPRDRRLEAGGTYLGVPVRRLPMDH